jgi:DNA-directed RNA polymerase III subunit RPC3
LVQQNLVYHHKDRETGITYYEAKQDAAYFLLRSGKIMDITETRFGVVARDIVQNLLLLGHTKIADLVEAYNSRWNAQEIRVNGHGSCPPTKVLHNGANGISDGAKLNNLDEVLCQLLEAELIEPVVESMFLSPSDAYQKVEREILQSHFGGTTKGFKQKDDLKSKVIDGLRALRHESKIWKSKGNKRPANGILANSSQKRQKLANGDFPGSGRPHGHHDENMSLDVSFLTVPGILRQ